MNCYHCGTKMSGEGTSLHCPTCTVPTCATSTGVQDHIPLLAEIEKLKAMHSELLSKLNVEVLDELKRLQDLHRWRNYPQEKPVEGQRCLVLQFNEDVIDSYYHESDWNNGINPVIRWLPYPKHEEWR